jgi:hypothetical protein
MMKLVVSFRKFANAPDKIISKKTKGFCLSEGTDYSYCRIISYNKMRCWSLLCNECNSARRSYSVCCLGWVERLQSRTCSYV